MSCINNVEKEKSLIYTTRNIKNKDELMIYSLYLVLYNSVLYSLIDNSILEKCCSEIKDKLYKYCIKISNGDEEVDFYNFMLGYLNELKNSIVDDFAIDYIEKYDVIIKNLDWVNDINNKVMSFDNKANVVKKLSKHFINFNFLISDIIEEPEDIKDEFQQVTLGLIKDFAYDNFDISLFETKLKEITRDYIIYKREKKEIDFNELASSGLKSVYDLFRDSEKKVLDYIIIYTMAGISFYRDEKEFVIEKLSEELNCSKFKTNLIFNKFIRKWHNFADVIDAYLSNDEDMQIECRVLGKSKK